MAERRNASLVLVLVLPVSVLVLVLSLWVLVLVLPNILVLPVSVLVLVLNLWVLVLVLPVSVLVLVLVLSLWVLLLVLSYWVLNPSLLLTNKVLQLLPFRATTDKAETGNVPWKRRICQVRQPMRRLEWGTRLITDEDWKEFFPDDPTEASPHHRTGKTHRTPVWF